MLKTFITVLIIFCSSLSLFAQPVSLFRYRSDTTSAVKQQMALLVSRPFAPEYDSVLKNLSLLMAYDTFSKSKRLDYTTPTHALADIYSHKAQSEWMLGMFKIAALPTLIRMESGVLPLLESSIGHLDSTVVFYGKVNKYMIGQGKSLNQIDSTFAKLIGDDVHQLLTRMEIDQNFEAARNFNLKARGLALFAILEKKFKKADVEQSLSYWLVSSLKDKENYEELKN